MKIIWRHYKGSKILNEGEVKAPCRVTAKRIVTTAIKENNVVPQNYKSRWSEKSCYTTTSIDDLRGVTYPMSVSREFIVFFHPEDEKKMITEMTSPKQLAESDQLDLFQ